MSRRRSGSQFASGVGSGVRFPSTTVFLHIALCSVVCIIDETNPASNWTDLKATVYSCSFVELSERERQQIFISQRWTYAISVDSTPRTCTTRANMVLGISPALRV